MFPPNYINKYVDLLLSLVPSVCFLKLEKTKTTFIIVASKLSVKNLSEQVSSFVTDLIFSVFNEV